MSSAIMRVLAVDPGARTGLAFTDGVRTLAQVERGTDAPAIVAALGRTMRPTHVVIELPRVHAVSRLKGNANQIVDLARLAGQIEGALTGLDLVVVRVKPSEWKGTVSKATHQARVLETLNDAARAAWRVVDHNGRDAIALAWWYLRGVRK